MQRKTQKMGQKSTFNKVSSITYLELEKQWNRILRKVCCNIILFAQVFFLVVFQNIAPFSKYSNVCGRYRYHKYLH